MFSVNKKSSTKTLELITGVFPMKARMKILKFKYKQRYLRMKNQDRMLLPIIETIVKHCNIMSRIEMIDTEISDVFSVDKVDDIKACIKQFTNASFEDAKEQIKIMENTPLKQIDNKKFQELVSGSVSERADVHMVTFFILNKLPGRPVKCKNCAEKVDKNHLVNCNQLVWENCLSELKRYSNGIGGKIFEWEEGINSRSMVPFF